MDLSCDEKNQCQNSPPAISFATSEINSTPKTSGPCFQYINTEEGDAKENMLFYKMKDQSAVSPEALSKSAEMNKKHFRPG